MCVLAYLPAPTVTLPSTGPRASLSSQPAVRSTPEHPVCTGAVALIPLNCNYLFTHLPLCQTVNSPHPACPRTAAMLCLIHLTSRHTVGAQEMGPERMRMRSRQRHPHILSPTLWPACPIIPSPGDPAFQCQEFPLGKPREPAPSPTKSGPAESDCSSGPPWSASAPLVSRVWCTLGPR